MKFLGLRNQLKALRAQLPARGLTIRIEGGLPPDYNKTKPPDPPGIELKAQAAAFRRPAGAPKTPEPTELAPPAKTRPRAS